MTNNMSQATPPLVKWAQRPNLVFVTVCLEDCKDPQIKVEPTRLHFKGTGGTDKKEYEVTLEFFKEIDPDKSKYAVRDRMIEFALEKKEEGPYWNRLLKEKQKQHWLKIDFNKWKDEDDSEDESNAAGGGGDLEEMMKSMGGLGGAGGMPPGMNPAMMGGMDRPNLDDLDDGDEEEEDSDDGEMPALE